MFRGDVNLGLTIPCPPLQREDDLVLIITEIATVN